eukprot:4453853-Alexandrium_andersonii.AAC.1
MGLPDVRVEARLRGGCPEPGRLVWPGASNTASKPLFQLSTTAKKLERVRCFDFIEHTVQPCVVAPPCAG